MNSLIRGIIILFFLVISVGFMALLSEIVANRFPRAVEAVDRAMPYILQGVGILFVAWMLGELTA